MMKKSITIVFLLILFLTCIVFNLIVAKRNYSERQGDPESDSVFYNSMALAILNGNSYFIWDNKKIDIGSEVTPFYPALVAACFFIGGVSFKYPFLLNVIFNCATIVLLFLTIKLVIRNEYISFLFSFGFIFYYPLWKMNFMIMMEVTSAFMLSLTIYLFSKYFYKNKIKYLYASTFVFSLLCLINNRFIVLLFTFFIYLIFYVFYKKSNFLRIFIIPFLIILCILSPWIIRQYVVYKQLVIFTPLWNNVIADKIGFVKRVDISTVRDIELPVKPLNYKEYIDVFKGQNNNEARQIRTSAFTFEKYKEIVAKHNDHENIYLARLKKYFTLYYKDFQFNAPNDFRLVVPTAKSIKMIQIIILFPLFVLSLLSFIISIKKRDFLIILLNAFIISHILLHVLVHYIDRYRLTILPVLLILAAYSFSEILKMIKNKFNRKIYKNEVEGCECDV